MAEEGERIGVKLCTVIVSSKFIDVLDCCWLKFHWVLEETMLNEDDLSMERTNTSWRMMFFAFP